MTTACIYPPSLAAFGPPKIAANPNADFEETLTAESKAASPQAAALIDEDLALGTKFGYRFTYTAGPKGKGRINTYTIHADPVTPGVSWDNYHFIDESDVIRFAIGKEANADDLPIGE